MKAKKSLLWVLFWICLALCFNILIYFTMGKQNALDFLGGYIVELSLSIDNLFLFIIVFSNFHIAPQYQRKILNYGIIGAIVLRLIFVILGVTIVNMFHWILYIFGIILIISGVKMMIKQEEKTDYRDSKILSLIGKIIPVTHDIEDNKFFVRKNKVLYATPLFMVLILIEFTDVLFAIDSVPAIFSITTNLIIVYTSNIFAILGLRSLYFLLGELHEKFQYVKYGVALILTFTGIKLGILFFHIEIPIELSLGIIAFLLAGSILASLIFTKKDSKK